MRQQRASEHLLAGAVERDGAEKGAVEEALVGRAERDDGLVPLSDPPAEHLAHRARLAEADGEPTLV